MSAMVLDCEVARIAIAAQMASPWYCQLEGRGHGMDVTLTLTILLPSAKASVVRLCRITHVELGADSGVCFIFLGAMPLSTRKQTAHTPLTTELVSIWKETNLIKSFLIVSFLIY